MAIFLSRRWRQQPKKPVDLIPRASSQVIYTPYQNEGWTVTGAPDKYPCLSGMGFQSSNSKYATSPTTRSHGAGNSPGACDMQVVVFECVSNASRDIFYALNGDLLYFENNSGTLSYYNGGNQTLGSAVPGRRHTLVFTYSDFSPNPQTVFLDGSLVYSVNSYIYASEVARVGYGYPGFATGTTRILTAAKFAGRIFSDAEALAVSVDPYGELLKPRAKRALYFLPAGGTTHVTSGALAASNSTIVGVSQHKASHTTSGALQAGSSLITGSASNFTVHSSSGTLLASSSVITGVSSNFIIHATSGALVSSSAFVTGTASNFTVHATSGALVSSSALIAGVADHIVPGATHTTSGALQAQVAQIVGSASNFTIHSSTGVLQSQGALIVGSADHIVPGTTHSTSGTLVSGQAVVSGTSQHKAKHDTSGALLTGAAIVAGTSQHKATHSSSGALLAGSSIIVGSASKSFGTTLPQASCIYPLATTYEAQIDNILIYPQKCSYPGFSQGGGARFVEYWIME